MLRQPAPKPALSRPSQRDLQRTVVDPAIGHFKTGEFENLSILPQGETLFVDASLELSEVVRGLRVSLNMAYRLRYEANKAVGSKKLA